MSRNFRNFRVCERVPITLASSTFRNVVSLKDQVEALQLAVDANVSALEITESNYEVGLITSLSVLDAQQDVFEVRRDLHKARYDYFQNLIALRTGRRHPGYCRSRSPERLPAVESLSHSVLVANS